MHIFKNSQRQSECDNRSDCKDTRNMKNMRNTRNDGAPSDLTASVYFDYTALVGVGFKIINIKDSCWLLMLCDIYFIQKRQFLSDITIHASNVS